jgi:diacylglycerol O-acyltransferase / wax synthase
MSAKRIESETFSSVDTAWLHMDSPTNLAIITGVITFEGVADFDRIKTTLQNRFLIHRRFSQRACESAAPLGLPRWETDPDFDIDYHLQRMKLPQPGDHAALQQLVGDLMGQPLDTSRPLWQFHFVENYNENSAMICRLHHCIADGLALVQVLLGMADIDPDAPWPELPPDEPQELSRLARWLRPAVKAAMTVGATWHKAEYLMYEGMETIIHPSRLVGAARVGANVTRALGKLVLIGPDRRTLFRGKCSETKRAAWSVSAELVDVKAIGQRMGGTVNDILLSAVTGALRRYLEEHGQHTEGLNIRAIVPVNLRPPEELDELGNRFGLVFLSLPIGIRDPLKRLVVLRHRMNEIKDSPEALVAFGILGAIGMTPNQIEDLIIAIFGIKGTAVMTNVPGPQQPLYFAGSKMTSIMFWVPTPANLGLGVSILSYAGQVMLGIATDAGLVPDPEAILQNFEEEMEYLKNWGRPQLQAVTLG